MYCLPTKENLIEIKEDVTKCGRSTTLKRLSRKESRRRRYDNQIQSSGAESLYFAPIRVFMDSIPFDPLSLKIDPRRYERHWSRLEDYKSKRKTEVKTTLLKQTRITNTDSLSVSTRTRVPGHSSVVENATPTQSNTGNDDPTV